MVSIRMFEQFRDINGILRNYRDFFCDSLNHFSEDIIPTLTDIPDCVIYAIHKNNNPEIPTDYICRRKH